jgi:peptide/nickel transport system ATP-binding protein
MQNGVFVEVADKQQLIDGTVSHPYTRVLMDGSRGYVPKRSTVPA